MNEKDKIKEKYDKMAEGVYQSIVKVSNLHKDISPVMKYFRQRKIETALQLGKFKKEDKILEVGSNMGQYTTLLAERGFSMVGIDLSEKTVEIAKKNAQVLNFKNVDYFPMDAEDLNLFANETFNGVISFSTLRYVPNLKQALKEIFRVLKKNGVAVLDFPNRHCPWFTLLKNKFGVENHIYDHFYSTKELISLYSEVGFKNIDIRKIMFSHYTFSHKFLRVYKFIDLIGENTLFLKELAAIILCKGIKI